MPVKNFGEKGARAYPGTVQIFGVPPIIWGTDKATNFKFCGNIQRVDPNKSPWNMLGIVVVGVVRESRKFSGHPCIGRIARSSLRYHSFLVNQANVTSSLSSVGLNINIHLFFCAFLRPTFLFYREWHFYVLGQLRFMLSEYSIIFARDSIGLYAIHIKPLLYLHACIVSKRLNVSSKFFHRLIGPSF